MIISDSGTSVSGPWSAHADELASWTWSHLVNRADAWGGYWTASGKTTQRTCPAKAKRGTVSLTDSILAKHYSAASARDVVGLHAVSPDNTSRWVALDIDHHGDGKAPPANLASAIAWYDRARGLGLSPLLEASNGRGGYHLWIPFAGPVPTTDAFDFALWFSRDWDEQGLTDKPESYPKQREVAAPGERGQYGNWLRLPGRHHTLDHWSSVWDGEQWLEGDAAAQHILSIVPADPERVPWGDVFQWRKDVRIEAYFAKLPVGKTAGTGRHHVGYQFACWLVRDMQLSDADAMRWLQRWNRECNADPKTEDDLVGYVQSAHEYGTRDYGHANTDSQGGSQGSQGTFEGSENQKKDSESEQEKPKWEPPTPFDAAGTLPTFPRGILADWLEDWVDGVERELQVPRELPAMLALTVAGGALAYKYRVQIRAGWSQPTNLFVACALVPGERKSDSFRRAVEPVKHVERELRKNTKQARLEAESKDRRLKKKIAHLEDKLAKAKLGQEAQLEKELADAIKALTQHNVPAEPALWADDGTSEHIVKLLTTHRKLLIASAEATPFENAKGRYTTNPNFEVYLKGYSGDAIRSGRITRSEDDADDAYLSAAVTLQPEVLGTLLECKGMLERGFLDRWLYVIPAPRVGTRHVREKTPMNSQVRKDYDEHMSTLWRTPGSDVVDEFGDTAPLLIHFSPEADEAMYRFEEWLEPQMQEGCSLKQLAGWPAKFAGAIARIAGILAATDVVAKGTNYLGTITVSGDCFARAVRLGKEFLLPHAFAAFGEMSRCLTSHLAKKAWPFIDRNTEGDVTTLNKMSQTCKHVAGLGTAEDFVPVATLLRELGYIRPVSTSTKNEKGGRPPSPKFELNPLARTKKQNPDTPKSAL